MSFRAFAALLKARRIELGYTQDKLAKLSGVKQETIYKIESLTAKDVRASTFVKLAKTLKWSGDQAFKAWQGKDPAKITGNSKASAIQRAINDFLSTIREIEAKDL